MKAVIYARFSSDRQKEESIEGQIRECTEYSKRNNIDIVGSYVDRALSASKETEKRLDFLRMVQDSSKHLFDIVLVWKLDRFSRDRYDAANYKHILKKNGVKVVSATEHIADGPEDIILDVSVFYRYFYSITVEGNDYAAADISIYHRLYRQFADSEAFVFQDCVPSCGNCPAGWLLRRTCLFRGAAAG